MNTVFKQYKSLLLVLIRQSKFKKNPNNHKKGKHVLKYIGIGLGIFAVACYFVLYALNLTISGFQIGAHKETLGAILGLSQMVIMFFGLVASMSYLYFSKDNELLSSLPLSQNVVFWAKFSMAYLSELLLCLFFAIPTALTYGIVSITMLNVALPASFFVILILSAVTLPIIPLLFVSVISIPLMYIVTFVKKRKMLSNLFSSLLFVVVMGLYFSVIYSSSYNPRDEEGNIIVNNSVATMIYSMYNMMFFNKPLINSLYGNNVILNLLYHILIVAGSGAIGGIISSLFYKKVLMTSNEGTKSISKNKKTAVIQTSSFIKSYTKKEISNIVHNSTMFINTIMMIAMPILILVFFSFTMTVESGEVDMTMFIVGMMAYMYTIMLCSNPITAIGFSREGKNIAILKTLPINVKDLIKVKLNLGMYCNLFCCISVTILLPIILKTKFYAGAIVGILSFISAFGINCLALRNDLSKPNLTWQNYTELTKNNKSTIKPMITSLIFGFFYIILGSLLSFMPWKVSLDKKLLIFAIVSIVPAMIIAILGRTKLYNNAEEYFERIEV